MIRQRDKNILLFPGRGNISGDFSESLEKCGYKVMHFSPGKSFYEISDEGRTVELAIIDSDPGGIDNLRDVTEFLKNGDIPVLFVYNNPSESAIMKTLDLNPAGYLDRNAPLHVIDAVIDAALKNHAMQGKRVPHKIETPMMIELIEKSNSIILRIDTEGRITYLNDFGLRFFGYSRDELIGREVVGTIVPAVDRENRDLNQMIRSIVTDTDRHITNENENMRCDGTRVWVAWSNMAINDENGCCMEVLCIGNDITGRKHAEEKIRESWERYRTLVESQLELVCIWLPDTTLTFVNQSYCRMLGKSKEELVGRKWIEFIPENSREEVMNNYELAISSKKVYSYIHEVQGSDSVRWFRWNDVPLFNEEGALIEFQSVGHDITERKLAEDRIRALLSEKELTLGEVHHRIKNNMGTIKALLLLQAESIKDKGAVSALTEAANRVQSMSALYDKLYTSYNYTEMPVTYYLSTLVDEIVANFPNSNSVSVEKKFDDFYLGVELLQPLGIIINELLTNIMKYAFAGRSDGRIELSLIKTDGLVTLAIQDNGVGIPDTVDLKSSAGFGMQLVGTLASQIHGVLSINRENGTRFTLEFGA